MPLRSLAASGSCRASKQSPPKRVEWVDRVVYRGRGDGDGAAQQQQGGREGLPHPAGTSSSEAAAGTFRSLSAAVCTKLRAPPSPHWEPFKQGDVRRFEYCEGARIGRRALKTAEAGSLIAIVAGFSQVDFYIAAIPVPQIANWRLPNQYWGSA